MPYWEMGITECGKIQNKEWLTELSETTLAILLLGGGRRWVLRG